MWSTIGEFDIYHLNVCDGIQLDPSEKSSEETKNKADIL